MTTTTRPTDEQIEWLKLARSTDAMRPELHNAWTVEAYGQTWLIATDAYRLHGIPHPLVEGAIRLGDWTGDNWEDLHDPETDDHWLPNVGAVLRANLGTSTIEPAVDLPEIVAAKTTVTYEPITFTEGSMLVGPDGSGDEIFGADIPTTLYRKQVDVPDVKFTNGTISLISQYETDMTGAPLVHASFTARYVTLHGIGQVLLNGRFLTDAATTGPITLRGVDALQPWIHVDDDRLVAIMPAKPNTRTGGEDR